MFNINSKAIYTSTRSITYKSTFGRIDPTAPPCLPRALAAIGQPPRKSVHCEIALFRSRSRIVVILVKIQMGGFDHFDYVRMNIPPNSTCSSGKNTIFRISINAKKGINPLVKSLFL